MSCTKEKVLSIAAHYIGYREKNHKNADLEDFKVDAGDGNYTKFSALCGYGIKPWQWCQLFVCGVAVEACGSIAAAEQLLCDQDMGDGVLTSYTPDGSSYFKAAGRWFTEPEPGDVVYFYSDSMKRICHTGYVETVDKQSKSFGTIEGNTNNDGFTTNGGCVARHTYSYKNVGGKNRVAGFGRPRYAETELRGMHLQIGGTGMICKVDTIKKGSNGPAVGILQALLKVKTHVVNGKLVPYYDGKYDKEFGPLTEAAVIAYQADRIATGVQIGGDDGKPDAVVGQGTWNDLMGLPIVQA